MNQIAFLDRDGVLNIDHDYVYRPEEFDWMPDAIEAVRWLNEHGFRTAVVTNQSGIGRGHYTEDEFHFLMKWVQRTLEEHGARLDTYYFCPHHPVMAKPPYRQECPCRKPNPGMLLQGLRDLDGDPRRSFLIGDKPTDIQAAEAAGVKGFLYKGGSLLTAVRSAVETLELV